MKNFFETLMQQLDQCERHEYMAESMLFAISTKIDWCFRHHKITAEEKDILADKVIYICKGEQDAHY